MKKSHNIFIVFIAAILFISCEKDKAEGTSDYIRSNYVGTWNIEKSNTFSKKGKKIQAKSITDKVINTSSLKTNSYYPNLVGFTPDGWGSSIVFKNDEIDGSWDDIYDDEIIKDQFDYIYVYYSHINENEYYNVEGKYTSQLLVDGEPYESHEVESLKANYYRRSWMSISSDYLSPGRHTITIKLDSNNDVYESNEDDNEYSREIYVIGNTKTVEYIDLLENRYYIGYSNGTSVFGKFSTNIDKTILNLDNIGTLEILYIEDGEMEFSLDDGTKKSKSTPVYSAIKRDDVIPETAMTKKLCGSWILTKSDAENTYENQFFSFYYSGRYMFEQENGEYYEKKWYYISEKEFEYSQLDSYYIEGSSTILGISASQLRIKDNYDESIYDFKKSKN